MSSEYQQPDRRFFTIISSRFLPDLPPRPGVPTSHHETASGTRIITLGEPITPFLPRHKAHFDEEGTAWTETTFLLDSQLRLPSGMPLPPLLIKFGTVGDLVGAMIKREYLAERELLKFSPHDASEATLKPGPLELLKGLSLTLSFPNGEQYTALPTYEGAENDIDLLHGFVSYDSFFPLQPAQEGKSVLYLQGFRPLLFY